MNLEIISADEVVSRKGGGKKKGARYPAYTKAIGPHVDWLKEQIEKSPDKTIRIKLDEFAKECGMKMIPVVDGKSVANAPAGSLDKTSLGWGFKYSLFQQGIFAKLGNTADKQPVLIMREVVEGDELPNSLKDKAVGGAVTETGDAEGEV